MGGQEAVRGFVLQTLCALLQALRDDDWESLQLEPSLANEKADLLWRGRAGLKAVQIKSSQNQIGMSQATLWSEELERTTKADVWELQLIGPCSQGVAVVGSIGNVKVPTPFPLNIPALVGQAAHKLDLYLEERGISRVPPFARELLVEALLSKLSCYSTSGKELSRVEIDRLMREWITTIYPNAVSAAVSEQFDVLWDTILFSPPYSPGEPSLRMVFTMHFLNEGLRTLIVEWIAARVTSDYGVKLYTPVALIDMPKLVSGRRAMHGDNFIGAFNEFAVRPKEGLSLHVGMDQEPANQKYPMILWQPGEHTFDLFVKTRDGELPRLKRTLKMKISQEMLASLERGVSTSNSERRIEI